MNSTKTLEQLEQLATGLRPFLRQNPDYASIMEVPYQHRIRVDVADLPAEVAEAILLESPTTADVVVGLYSRKGEERLQFMPGSGSDGFPVTSVPIGAES